MNIINKFRVNHRGLLAIKETMKNILKDNEGVLTSIRSLRKARIERDKNDSPLQTHQETVRLGDESSLRDGSTVPDISIIVPVFNTALYLEKCLDSLVNQSLQNIEILCVDDGSEDGSLDILKRYQEEDARIRVFEQDHKGVSAARNTALSAARAPYIMSCDSDDSFDPEMCQILLKTLLEEDVDVVICGWKVTFEVPEELRQNVEEYLRLKFYGKQEIAPHKLLITDVSLCNKIYKRSIIEEHAIDFPDGLLFEDAYFNDAYMTVSRYIYYLHLPLYNYLRHDASVMSTSYKKTGTAFDYLQIAFKTWDYLKRENLLESHCDYFWRRFIQYFSFANKHLEGESLKQARKLARDFVDENKNHLAKASVRTRGSVYILLYGRFKALYWLYHLPKQVYHTVSVNSKVRGEILELGEQVKSQQAQIAYYVEEEKDLL